MFSLPQLQKRLFAWGMAKVNAADDRTIRFQDCPDYDNLADLKQDLLSQLQGTVLEIGPGAGANLAYYPTTIRWIGIEPNPFMHAYLHQEAARQGLAAVELYEGTAEQLPIADHSVDAAVSTHVLCSVRDVAQVLQEIQRVLKPGGRFIFLEHVAGACGTWTRRVQDGIQPIWTPLFDHCHPNRDTGHAIDQAGFQSVQYQRCRLNFPVVGPHITGIAVSTAGR
jgi:ubiquinone/menaquinone biosynthesis C-methylase UbiE